MSIFKLEGVIQHYAWGGTSFIPNLLSVANTEELSFAELWMGTHPKGAAVVINGEEDIGKDEEGDRQNTGPE